MANRPVAQYTRIAASFLLSEFHSLPTTVDVLLDHKKVDDTFPLDSVGEIASWVYPPNLLVPWDGIHDKRSAPLAEVDIAVVLGDRRVHTLLEIEETRAVAKELIGKILGVLLGSGIVFRRKEPLRVGPQTRLVTLIRLDDSQQSTSSLVASKLQFVVDRIGRLKDFLDTPNACMTAPVLRTFHDRSDLTRILGGLFTDLSRLRLEYVPMPPESQGTVVTQHTQRLPGRERMPHGSRRQSSTEANRTKALHSPADTSHNDPTDGTDITPEQRTGRYLSEQFKKTGFSREEAARRAGISPTYLTGILAGRRALPNPDIIRNMSEQWGFPILDFYVHGPGLVTRRDIEDFHTRPRAKPLE
ncbi:MAG: helix-turn-helix domain-containing protein [Chloroflexota bacterium]